MKDPVNPTALDIEAWARDPEAMYPMQDWDLMVASDDNGEPPAASSFRRLRQSQSATTAQLTVPPS